MILCIENPKESTHTHELLELMHKFGKTSGYKIDTQKQSRFYMPAVNTPKKKTNNSIYNSIQNINIPRINLTKEVKYLCTENYKILLKGIKDLNKWKDIPCS